MKIKKIHATTKKIRKKTFLLTPNMDCIESYWDLVFEKKPEKKLGGAEIKFSKKGQCDVIIKVRLQDEKWEFLDPSRVSGGTWASTSDKKFVEKTSCAGLTIKTPTSMQDDTTNEGNIGILTLKTIPASGVMPSSTRVDPQTISLTFSEQTERESEKTHFKFVAYLRDGIGKYTGYVSADPLFGARIIP